MTMTYMNRVTRIAAIALLIWMAVPGSASAQGYISPLIGYDFGGDSGCPEITNCEDRNLNWGVAAGSLGSIVGSELELAYAKDFFGKIQVINCSLAICIIKYSWLSEAWRFTKLGITMNNACKYQVFKMAPDLTYHLVA